ncbi:MAG: flavodoxin family protein, partial [Pseudomonadales bacterium]|nr:flavodoxin family protein [Pseudomonadales bacterium]
MAATKLPEVSTRLAVVYFSQTNSTHQLANAIITGINSISGTMTLQHRIRGTEIHNGRFQNRELIQRLQTCHGIVFGTPTYMGCVSAQFKAFADATSELWATQSLAGKMAAGFTCGASINGDQGTT